jgi:hypothetical protein
VYVDNYDPVNQEILARIRVLDVQGTAARVGLGAGVNLQSQGMNLVFTRPAAGPRLEFQNDLTGTAQVISGSWQQYQWYWVRFQHAVEGGRALARAKVWLADGDTPEPDTWQLWDYAPAASAASGHVAITGTSEDQLGMMEVDWMIVKASGLAAFTALPPRRPDPGLILTKTGNEIMISWAAELPEFTLHRNPLLDWDWQPVYDVQTTPYEIRYFVPAELGGTPNEFDFYKLMGWPAF